MNWRRRAAATYSRILQAERSTALIPSRTARFPATNPFINKPNLLNQAEHIKPNKISKGFVAHHSERIPEKDVALPHQLAKAQR
jgi:hypothetical protein